MKSLLDEVRRQLSRSLRLATFRNVGPGQALRTYHSLIALIAIVEMLALAGELLRVWPVFWFNPVGLAAAWAAWSAFLMLVALFLRPHRDGAYSATIADAIGVTAIAHLLFNLVAIVNIFIPDVSAPPNARVAMTIALWITHWLVFLCMLVGIARAGRVAWPEGLRVRGLRLVAASLLPIVLVPSWPTFGGPGNEPSHYDIWTLGRTYYSRFAAAGKVAKPSVATPPRDYEATIYRQPAMVERALADVLKSPADRPRFYFVGVGASATEEVFRREILGAKAVFEERFAARGQSLVLINSWQTASDIPLATMTNLEAALAGVADRMNVEQDILVLFVTSHGQKGKIQVQFPGVTLNQLSISRLDGMLRKSGIKNKVLIISACHSGSFVAPLADDDTLIMTASHADKTSFGCSNEREWTYFGDALFNNALRETTSLQAAFERARSLIGDWETSQKLTPSEPQLWVGSRIGRKLEMIDAARRAEAPALER